MNEKITMQDIIDQVAKKHDMPRKDAEAFVRGMFELITDALDTENYVKIKGLGTFKLTEVDSRESVNVNTGERIEIQGHTKITFTPDATMKDQINKPFAHFETVILNEGTRTEDMEAEETVLPLEEEIPVEEATPVVQVEAAAVEEEAERKTPWGVIIAIILVLCLAGGIYWFMQSTPDEPQTPTTTVVETPKEETLPVQPQDTVAQEEVKADSVVAVEPKQKVILNDTIEYEITGTKTTLTLQPGETLVKLALRFYGTKNLWHYIVQHNQNVITDANVVPVGTTLRIPELSPKK